MYDQFVSRLKKLGFDIGFLYISLLKDSAVFQKIRLLVLTSLGFSKTQKLF